MPAVIFKTSYFCNTVSNVSANPSGKSPATRTLNLYVFLASVKYSLTGIDLNPIQRNLGTDRIVAPGYNRKSSKEFIAPAKNGSYMVTANWKDQQGWPIARLVDRQQSITINVSEQTGSVPTIVKPSIGDSIQTGLKTSAFIIWGILAIIVAREFRK